MRTASLLTLAAAALFALNAAAADSFLADRHAARSVPCTGCHTAMPPTADNTSPDLCIKCHGGSYGALVKRTEGRGDINYHDTHIGEAACRECHHGHRSSDLICNQCHEFKAKVP